MDGNYSCDCPDGTMKNGTDCICKNLKLLHDIYVHCNINKYREITCAPCKISMCFN